MRTYGDEAVDTIFGLLAILLFVLIVGVALDTYSDGQNIEGQIIASQYGTWKVPGYAPDTYTFAPNTCRVQGGSSYFNAFSVGTPVLIVDGNPALSEIVTPKSVTINNTTCVISIAPVNHHNLPFYLTSATGGLQEAINSNATNPGANTIILSNAWYQQGGDSTVILNAIGTTGLGLVDITTLPSTWYQWNGSHYAAVPVGSSPVDSVFGRIGNVVAQAGDYNCAQVTGCLTSAPVASVFGRTGAVTAQSGDYTCIQVTGCGEPPNAWLQTALSASIGSSDTTIPLAASPAILTAPGAVVIDGEWIKYSGVSGDTLTGATRGYHQTAAASHNLGAYVYSVLTDFGNPSQTPYNFLISRSGSIAASPVFGCESPDTDGSMLAQFGCAGINETYISNDGSILQTNGSGLNKLESATGIGPGGGKADIADSGNLFDSTRQNQSAVPQGFGAGIAGPVESIQPTTIGAPSILNFANTGTTTWSYECTGTDVDGNTFPGTVASITNGPTTITSGEIIVTCPFSAGAAAETIWRTAGGPNEGTLSIGGQPWTTIDTGLSVTPGTPPATNSSIPKVCVAGETTCLITGSTAPSGTCTDGWLYTNTAGSPTLYACGAGAWSALSTGDVASVFSRTGAVTAQSGDYTAAQVTNAAATNAANTFTAAQTNSTTGAASAPAMTYTGAPYTGGTGTTTYPYWYYNCSGSTAPTTFSTSGTIVGVNTCNGFGGNLLDLRVNGGQAFYVNAGGSGVFSATVEATNVAIETTETVVNCSTSGSVDFAQPQRGNAYKQIVIYVNGCTGTASYTFPTAFSHTPQVLSQSNAALATSVSTTAVTITGSSSTGFLDLDGW